MSLPTSNNAFSTASCKIRNVPPYALALLSHYLIKLAKIGGYLARKNDGPPGNTVIWRGPARLTDIETGVLIGKGDVGN